MGWGLVGASFPAAASASAPSSSEVRFPVVACPRLRISGAPAVDLGALFACSTPRSCYSVSLAPPLLASPFGMPIALFTLQRNHSSPRSPHSPAPRRRLSAAPSGDQSPAMLLDADAGGNQPASEKDLLHPHAASSKVLTLPTVLTLGRVAAIPVLLCVFYSSKWWATAAVACIFVLAAITDWLDGFLARKMGSNSTFGAFLDPVADKLMVATTLVLLCTKPLSVSWAAALPWLVPLPAAAIIGREITMSAVREWAASQGGDLQAAVAVNRLGKWKTASQMVALTVLLATRDGSQNSMTYLLTAIGVGTLYISAGLALWSLAVYIKGIWGELIK